MSTKPKPSQQDPAQDPTEALEPLGEDTAAQSAPDFERAAEALSNLGLSAQDLADLASPQPSKEQTLAGDVVDLLRREHKQEEERTARELDEQFLWYLECRFCHEPGIFFSGNPHQRSIRIGVRFNPTDEEQRRFYIGVFGRNRPIGLTLVERTVACQCCDRPLPFRRTDTNLFPNIRFVRSIERERLQKAGVA